MCNSPSGFDCDKDSHVDLIGRLAKEKPAA
jgi:hypothetical protein